MTQVIKRLASSPSQAVRRRSKMDALLDPELFKAIGEPTRAKLLTCLIKCGRPCSVTEVAACCSIDFSMVARHLTALARAGVLDATKQGRTVWYQVRSAELSERFAGLAEAINDWHAAAQARDSKRGCSTDGCCDT